MLSLRAPSTEKLRAWSSGMQSDPFNYPGIGTTRDLDAPGFAPPRGFKLDRRRTRLGAGDELFDTAADAILHGRMFPTGWFVAVLPARALGEGDVLAIAARCGGLWWTNAARVVYVVDEQDEHGRRRGFAYGTLPTHVERGEERFVVEQLPDGSVWFDLAAFSRPRHPLVWAAYPLTRYMQERFRHASAAALQSAVAEAAFSATERWL